MVWDERQRSLRAESGFADLKDLPPIHKRHLRTTPAETVARTEELALAHPAYGCNRVEAMLLLEGRRASAITIWKLLNDNGPVYPPRSLAGAGEAQSVLPRTPCRARRAGRVVHGRYLLRRPACVRQAPSRAWARSICARWWIPTARMPSASCASPSSPSPRRGGGGAAQRRAALLSSAGSAREGNPHRQRGREFCGTGRHAYELYLDLNGIEHRRTKVRSPKANGFV